MTSRSDRPKSDSPNPRNFRLTAGGARRTVAPAMRYVLLLLLALGGARAAEPAGRPTLYLIGDSTVRNGEDNGQGLGPAGQWGWGHEIARYFNPAKIRVVNAAIGGRSSRTYYTDGHWAGVLARLKPGDFVLMQFGHNDGGAINDTSRARGTLKGIGPQQVEIDNLLTKRHEVVHTYGWYLRAFIEGSRAKGATPLVCSPIPRKIWDPDGRIHRDGAGYAGWAKAVAEAEHAPFVDLNTIIADRYDAMGKDAVMALFPPGEHTHTNLAGAKLNAQCVVAGLEALHPDPLGPYLAR